MVSTSRFLLLCGICSCALAPVAALADAGNSATSGDYEIVILPDQKAPAHETQIHIEDGVLRFYTGGEPKYDVSEETADTAGTRTNSSYTDIGYSGQIFLRDSDDKISGVRKWEKELRISLDYKDWSAYFRVGDYNVFAGRNDPFRWEKGNLRYRHEDYKLTLGSFGAVFNRGLTLNMFEDQNLDFDNEIEGVKVEYSPGNTELTALWGTRKDRQALHDSEVSAARLMFPVSDELTAGINAVEVKFPKSSYTPDTPAMNDFHILGGNINLRSGDLTVNAEVATLDRGDAPPVDSVSQAPAASGTGKGYYVNTVYSTGPMVLNLEYKDYTGMAQPFSVVPPLRRWNEQATSNADDDRGYGAELTYSLSQPGSYIQTHWEQDNAHAGSLPHTEFAAIYNSATTGDTSFTAEYWNVNSYGTKHNVQRLTLNHKFDDDWTASTFLERERYSGDLTPYFDYIIEAEFAYQSKLNVVYTTEMTGKNVSEGQDDRWGIWEFKYKPDELQEFNLALGSRREGYVCSGGVCRVEPAFDGFKVDYLRRF